MSVRQDVLQWLQQSLDAYQERRYESFAANDKPSLAVRVFF